MLIKRRYRYLIFGFLLITLCYCENQIEYNSEVKISIENFSEHDIDSLRIAFRTRVADSFHWEEIIFKNIESGAISELHEAMNVNFELLFKAYFNGDSIKEWWVCPYKAVDPTFYAIPNGYYHFGIIEFDTFQNSMVIGLAAYN